MKIKVIDKKKLLIGVCILLFLVVLSNTLARTEEAATDKKPGIASQFISSFKCILTDCGWPAIVIMILPAIAIYIYKKVFSLG